MTQATTSSDNLSQWLRQRGLQANPFAIWNAESDPHLPHYFVDMAQFDELLHVGEPCIIFGDRGMGKTAQRQMIAAECRPIKENSPFLAVHYTYPSFEQVMKLARHELSAIRPEHHVVALLRVGLDALVAEIGRDKKLRENLVDTPNAQHKISAYQAYLLLHLPGSSSQQLPQKESLSNLGSLELLTGFARLVQEVGLQRCLILVDGLDEYSPVLYRDAHQWGINFIAPLLGVPPLIECPGLAFKFSLPQGMKLLLLEKHWFRPDRIRIFSIVWAEEALFRLIEQRLAHFSANSGRVYTCLGEFCEENLARRLDKELIALAQGSPRTTLRLADLLFRTHCKQGRPPQRIEAATWNTVKLEWQRETEFALVKDSQPFQPLDIQDSTMVNSEWPLLQVDEKQGLVWLGDTEIRNRIRPKEYQVLLCLYRNQNKVCSRDQIAEEAWREVTVPGAVSDDQISASIRRLRKNLGQYTIEAGYIETIRGGGFRLHPRGFTKPE